MDLSGDVDVDEAAGLPALSEDVDDFDVDLPSAQNHYSFY